MVTAGAPDVPQPLLDPIRRRAGFWWCRLGCGNTQTLMKIVKRPEGPAEETEVLSCRFVPLLGRFAWDAAAYEQARG